MWLNIQSSHGWCEVPKFNQFDEVDLAEFFFFQVAFCLIGPFASDVRVFHLLSFFKEPLGK